MMGRRAEPPLLIERLDLDHGAVGVVPERVTVALELLARGDDRGEIRAPLRARVRLEAGRAQRLEHVPVGGEAQRVGAAQVIEEDVERAAGGDRRILLPHGARRGVPRVGERGRAGLFQRPVEASELLARHEDLAAHLEDGRAGQSPPQHHRDRSDRPEVRRDVLAHAPVAARGAADEAAVLVQERDAQAVDLRLAHVGERSPRQRAADPGLELAQIVRRGRVVEGEHGVVMLDRLEDVGRRPTDALRGAVRGDEVGKRRLELAQLAHEGVVLGVRDFGPRFDVVQIVVVVDLLAQLGDPLRGVGPRHANKITLRRRLVRRADARRTCRGGAGGGATGLGGRGRLRRRRGSRPC